MTPADRRWRALRKWLRAEGVAAEQMETTFSRAEARGRMQGWQLATKAALKEMRRLSRPTRRTKGPRR